jgi:eukaryotic-like serine/threonine-protein kinase
VRTVPTASPWTSRLRRSSVAAALFCLTALPTAAQPAPEGSWPMAGGDARHSGTAEGPAPPYRTAWTARLEGEGRLEGPVVSGQAVVVVGSGSVMALDAASGRVRWEAERQEGPAGSPAVAGDLLIHTTGRDAGTALVARRIDDGREEWRVFAGGAIPGGLAVDGPRAYAATRAGRVLAVDAATGEEEWRFRAAGVVGTTPAVLDELVLISAQNRSTGTSTLHAVDSGTGQEEWRFSPPATQPSAATSPAAGEGLAFAGLSDGRVHAFDVRTGTERWSGRPLPLVTAFGPFVPSGVPAASGSDGTGLYLPGVARLVRLEPATGRERWSYQLPDLIEASSPSLSGSYALLGDASGLAAAIDVRSGLLVWKRRLGPGPVGPFAVTPDRLFVSAGREDGVVVALEHDPEGALLSEESPTVLDPIRAGLNFVAAALALGVLLVLLFRGPGLLRRRSGEPA